jgi:N-hydroxyarylamine O-acetyltransferase
VRPDVDAYLRRLGIADPGEPSVEALHRLHAAHVERVPYETLEIALGRPTSIAPRVAAAWIAGGRGGYCLHLNGAFSELLTALGYRVTRHLAGVQGSSQPEPVGADANHLALTVDLPGDGTWMVDVGLGDALYQPIPLRPGRYRQEPFEYRLGPSTVVSGGWRFTHDPTVGSFRGMDFDPAPARLPEDFRARHREMSTDRGSPFVRVVTVQRRDASGVQALRGCVLTRVDAAGRHEQEIEDGETWFGLIRDTFGIALDDVDAAEREALWVRVRAAHLAWRAGVG